MRVARVLVCVVVFAAVWRAAAWALVGAQVRARGQTGRRPRPWIVATALVAAGFLVVVSPAGAGDRRVDVLSQANVRLVGGPTGSSPSAGLGVVARAGDVNGDGIPDVLLSAEKGVHGGQLTGNVFVVFGSRRARRVDLDRLGSQGYRILGEPGSDSTGIGVTALGDVNGDGLGDVAVSDLSGKHVWVVFGQRSSGDIDLGHLGAHGYRINPPAGSAIGSSVAGLGDVNGDGIPDLAVVGGNEPRGSTGQTVDVLFLHRGSGDVNLGEPGWAGFRIDNINFDPEGSGDIQVAAGRDVNGDGRPDIVVSSDTANFHNGAQPLSRSGEVDVIYGKSSSTAVDDRHLAGRGFRILGREAGTHIAGAGDVNHDGFADIITSDDTGADVIFGGRHSRDVRLDRLGARGFRIITGHGADALSADAVAGGSDVNHDGSSDVLIGATTFGAHGSAFLIYGGRSTQTVNLRHVGSRGYRIVGTSSGDGLGAGVAFPGDVNRDGTPDLLLGSSGDDRRVSDYLLYGAGPPHLELQSSQRPHVNQNGQLNLTLLCPATAPGGCRTRLLLRSRNGRLIAHASRLLPAGLPATIRLTLTPPALAQLRRQHHLTAQLTARSHNHAGSTTRSWPLQLVA